MLHSMKHVHRFRELANPENTGGECPLDGSPRYIMVDGVLQKKSSPGRVKIPRTNPGVFVMICSTISGLTCFGTTWWYMMIDQKYMKPPSNLDGYRCKCSWYCTGRIPICASQVIHVPVVLGLIPVQTRPNLPYLGMPNHLFCRSKSPYVGSCRWFVADQKWQVYPTDYAVGKLNS